MSSSPKLRVDYCDHAAAKYAITNWHYSRVMPVGKMVKVGIWEDERFVGAIIYSCGASPPMYKWAKRELGIENTEACELTRVAMRKHATPVSQSLGRSIKLLKRACPGLRLIVSFADVDEDHFGTIYQATNWIYCGLNGAGTRQGFRIHGKKVHARSLGAKTSATMAGARAIDPNATEVITKGKRKYLMPLDKKMRRAVERFRTDYPKANAVEA